jgi:uncharacterized damage-inducible protein DinB
VTEFPEPRGDTGDSALLVARYLRFYRETVVRKARALPDDELRTSRLPSGWTPIELVQHLAYMERRWLVWGFLGEQVADPWGDGVDDRWHVAEDVGMDDVVRLLEEVGERTAVVLAEHRLDEVAVLGGRFDREPPTLAWICFHVLQEFARHAGHLDVAVELAGGGTGE